MKTDRLIDVLSTNLEPTKPSRLGGLLASALLVGGVAAFCAMLATAGMSADPADATDLGFLALKLLLAFSLIAIGFVSLLRSAVPGRNWRRPYALSFAPLFAVAAAGIAVLVCARPTAWAGMLLGTQWRTCLICIPLYATVPFAALIWALRRGAPTDPVRAGAVAGLVAGALGAAAYAFQCPDDSVPFVALWYGGTIALCAMVGGFLGPRLLRW